MNVQAVGDVARWTYNDIKQDYCDPMDHTIDSIELIGFSPRSNGGNSGTTGCTEYDATFRLTGRCRGCTDASTLILESSPTSSVRQLSMHDQDPVPYPLLTFGNVTTLTSKPWIKSSSQQDSSGRGLLASLGDDCFCDGSIIANRAPNTDEYNKAFAAALGEFQLTKVCGLPNFVPTPSPALEGPATQEPTREQMAQPPPPPHNLPNNNNNNQNNKNNNNKQNNNNNNNNPRPPRPPVTPTLPKTPTNAPVGPVGPTAPIIPTAPLGPIGPTAPAGPTTPTSAPVSTPPAGPTFPKVPSSPVAPGGRRLRCRRLLKRKYLY
jgi:hypothetical protein